MKMDAKTETQLPPREVHGEFNEYKRERSSG